MGQQISFFRNATVEARLLNEVTRLGLFAFPLAPTEQFQTHLQNLTAFGLVEPTKPSAWSDGDYIEYGYFQNTYSARLWFDPLYLDGTEKPAPICDAYRNLVKFVKRGATFSKEERLWVPREFQQEFQLAEEEKKRAMELLVQRNRLFAVNKLGARLTGKKDAPN